MIVFQVDAFRPLARFKEEVAEFARYLKDTPPSAGSAGVLYPGEVEHRAEVERSTQGVQIEDATWAKLSALAVEVGLPEPTIS